MNAPPKDSPIIAQRVFLAVPRTPDSAESSQLSIEIFQPIRAINEDGDDVWSCAIKASGVCQLVQILEGRDSFEALEFALAFVATLTISLSGKYFLRSVRKDAGRTDGADVQTPYNTLMHGLISAKTDEVFGGNRT